LKGRGRVTATRKNILAPGSIGVYSAGGNYNPAQVIREDSVKSYTDRINRKVADIRPKGYKEMSIDEMKALILLTRPDDSQAERVWNSLAITETLDQFAKLRNQSTGYVYVDIDRDLAENRRETAGILTGGEYATVPSDKVALYLLRTRAKPGSGSYASWWPQIRFPAGRYAFAFAV
jgi:hypothetical protein